MCGIVYLHAELVFLDLANLQYVSNESNGFHNEGIRNEIPGPPGTGRVSPDGTASFIGGESSESVGVDAIILDETTSANAPLHLICQPPPSDL